ncbi:MAG: hypothetical protein KDA63_20635 [Planctomycetales bacterium]|nr:hypothetical protein [Planctomycetales bacterium]
MTKDRNAFSGASIVACARQAVVGTAGVMSLLLMVNLGQYFGVLNVLVVKSVTAVATGTVVALFLTLAYRAQVPAVVRHVLVISFVLLMADRLIDVTQEIGLFDSFVLLGRHSVVGAVVQHVASAMCICAWFVVMYLLLRFVDEAQSKYRKNLDELALVSRRNTIGELSSGIAHELNQPLTAIANYAHGASTTLRRDGLKSPEQLSVALDKIVNQACRAGEIVNRLRRSLRSGDPRFEAVDLAAVVDDAVSTCVWRGSQLRQRFEVQCAEQLPTVRADAVQIQQVVVNLLINAVEANASCPHSDGCVRVVTAVCDGGWVEVAVTDSGAGLSPDVASRVFEPFFTTKHEGLGIGLAISRSIAEAHGGRLQARNNAGHGATFALQLPVRHPAQNGDLAPVHHVPVDAVLAQVR